LHARGSREDRKARGDRLDPGTGAENRAIDKAVGVAVLLVVVLVIVMVRPIARGADVSAAVDGLTARFARSIAPGRTCSTW
jgi:hypothetical protein